MFKNRIMAAGEDFAVQTRIGVKTAAAHPGPLCAAIMPGEDSLAFLAGYL